MNEAAQPWDVGRSAQTYNVDRWGAPYFSINARGNVTVAPVQDRGPEIEVAEVARVAREHGLRFPLVLRFQDVLRNRVETINETFAKAMAEYGYGAPYRGVFPIKVNQLREVVEEVLDAGKPHHFGLEVGSKPELVAALAMHKDPESLLICNGYKDPSYIRLALIGKRLGKRAVIVVEKLEEIPMIIATAREVGVDPWLGIRVRLKVRSAGKWATSSGEDAKFGLCASDLVDACDLLAAEGMQDCVKLLHSHIGSQIPDIRIVNQAVRELGRYYGKIRQMGFPVEFVDIGGGLGVDYDGSRSASESSVNYTLREYCSDVVATLAEICEAEKVPHPTIVSESGRALVAHHSVLVVDVFGSAEKTRVARPASTNTSDHKLVAELRKALDKIGDRNRREMLHDAAQIREESESLFALGLLGLRDKAQIDDLYWHVAERVAHTYDNARVIPEEIRALETSLGDQYICNFSVFQSLIDHWAVGQLFPVMPLSRLGEEPSNRGFLVDITCDSDGKMAKFIDADQVRDTLPLHHLDGNPYLLGFFLVGAYQDVMGDIHNLFGRTHEAHIFLDPEEPGGFYIEETIPGDKIRDVLAEVQYDIHELEEEIRAHADAAVKANILKPSERVRIVKEYQSALDSHTYLELP